MMTQEVLSIIKLFRNSISTPFFTISVLVLSVPNDKVCLNVEYQIDHFME